ncbi:MAG: choice-of-anchor R domain-containing protein [Candidatus Daviesbacteria bacterium]|nr:choice-of-anchor R domain-containing protein [Candidatus Daviesbacteria bacterium]
MSKQSGQILVLAIIVAGLVLVNILLIIGGSQLFFQNTSYTVESAQALNLAEAGVNKALASLNKTGGNYNGETETFFGAGSYSVTVTNKGTSTKVITSTGYIPNKTNPKTKRTIQTQISTGEGISFVYGMLVGNGGFTMGNGATINGSIYSNGSIVGGNNEIITGDTYVAGGAQPNPDQQTDCNDSSCTDFIFGKNVGGVDRLDVAQSFKPSSTALINKVSLKLKKFGSPANITVRLLGDSSGKPNKSNVLASGILTANLVTNQYSLIDVAFTTTPTLTVNTSYWIMLDTSSNSSNYWSWSMDTLQSYTRGVPLWSANWSASNPIWNNISGDLGFKTWMGGVVTSISMGNGSVVRGNTHANTISGLTINKDAYYQTINNTTVNGTSYPNSTDPAPIEMPISAANITDWQSQAEALGVQTGEVEGCHQRLGPGKIVGKIEIENQCTVIVTTPIWVTGDISVGNNVIFKMDPNLGASSGFIIVDGKTTFHNGNNLLGTGIAGSYLMLLSTYNSESNGIAAISTGNSSITGILYAPFGTIQLANNATFKEAVAWKIDMGTDTTLTYDSGLISTFFSSGPSGSYSLIKGTYQLK